MTIWGVWGMASKFHELLQRPHSLMIQVSPFKTCLAQAAQMKHFTDDTEWGVVYTGWHQDIPWPGCALTCLHALHSPSADPHWEVWLNTDWHSSLVPCCNSLLTHCLKLKVLHHDCQILQCVPRQTQAHITNKLCCSARQKQCKTSLNTCFLEPCSWKYLVLFFLNGWASYVTT